MALDLSEVQLFPHFKTTTLNDTNALEIKISEKSKKISIGSETVKLFVARNGATDGAAMPADKLFINAGNLLVFEWQLGTGKPESIFVSASTAPAQIVIVQE
jgi:hypothetical protein